MEGKQADHGTASFVPVILVFGLLLAGMVLSCCCVGKETKNATSGQEKVAAVTILPQRDLVREIAGENWTVMVVVPPGADPHTHEPTATEIARLGRADVYFRLGPGLLPFEDVLVARLVAQNPGMLIVDTSAGIPLIHETGEETGGGAGEHGADPHVWLSPSGLRTMAENVFEGLSGRDPTHREDYRARTDAYLRRVDACEESIRKRIAGLEGRPFLVSHPAWGYFAREFGLSQVSINGEGREPTARELFQLVSYAREEGIRVVLTEPEFSARESEVIAREVNASVVVIDPLAPDVLLTLERMAKAIADSYVA